MNVISFRPVWPVLVLLSLLTAVQAGPKPKAPAPFGFAVGEASLSEVESGLGQRTTVKPIGINKYSAGPMLEADGAGLDVPDLQRAVFVFDTDRRLAAVLLTFIKQAMDRNFDELFNHLAAKYALVLKQVPFVGNKRARFAAGSVWVDLESPHMGFTITIFYRTQAFNAAFDKQQKQEQEQETANTRRQF